MVDRYTKIVLTVIAVALGVIAVREVGALARAGVECGYARSSPCYVDIGNWPAGMIYGR